MSSIDQIVNELLAVDSDISKCTSNLEREREEIANSIKKVQSAFADQQAGLNLATILYETIQKIVNADTALFFTRQEIKRYVQNSKK